ncbi:glycosyltransferase family 2 protein [Sphingobacterium sp. UDSM-2020]|uniref:glycosyltransferase family 2 protein n=1 Tax=Sphingobacterium sp. UDSM-2020 TaxID=2795738 RepID=UPI0019383A61|nr:glycosyltransferase family A protein [Sphingobacterium sp. UDSM-2020]QQD15382.1 glycosyltransferase family 2 protein [Sphingobacterium sp. UDSM-2020]
MDKKILTVFTPTYNRESLLPNLYKSLCSQTNHDFLWLIIDDGSQDRTGELVKKWQADGLITIQYHYKENGGMHTGHNSAYELIQTELNVCIDSDDYMPDNAVELILEKWACVVYKDKYAGIIGLDAFTDNSIVGSKIPENLSDGSLSDLYKKYGVTGDKKVILRTDVVKKYPAYPEYKNEKLVPLGTLYTLIGADYSFLYSNDIYCIVDYQPDGSSHTIFRQYKQSPKGFAYARKIHIKYADNLLTKLKGYVNLVSSALFAKDISLAFKGVNPILTILMFPFGTLLYLYIRFKIKK